MPSIALALRIRPAIIAELITFKMVDFDAAGLPQLTTYGEKFLIVMETVDGLCCLS
jgi:hypothetical protein